MPKKEIHSRRFHDYNKVSHDYKQFGSLEILKLKLPPDFELLELAWDKSSEDIEIFYLTEDNDEEQIFTFLIAESRTSIDVGEYKYIGSIFSKIKQTYNSPSKREQLFVFQQR